MPPEYVQRLLAALARDYPENALQNAMEGQRLGTRSDGPEVTEAMLDRAVAARARSFHAYVTDALARSGDRIAGAFEDMLRQAYVAGVRDGYTQGLGKAIAGAGIAGDGPPES